MDEAAKRKRVTALQRYVLNPRRRRRCGRGSSRATCSSRRRVGSTGKRRTNVVGMKVDGNTGWVIAEQGRHAGYVRNLDATPGVRVRIHRSWRRARASVVADDDAEARLTSFGRRTHAATLRRFGTDLTTIRFDFS